MLPDQAITDFQSIYSKEYGINLPFDQAKQKAENFIQLFDLITKPQVKKANKDSENA